MNSDLIKFIEFCLADGVISDKEREVIFRKAKEYGVPEDECEIILEGMIVKKQKSFQKLTDSKTKISPEDNYVDVSLHKEWFLEWLNSDKNLNEIKNKKDKILRNWIMYELEEKEKDGIYFKNAIKKETLLKLCDLKEIPDTPATFWKPKIYGKRGVAENKFKSEINEILNKERFICYISASEFGSSYSKKYIYWEENDINQIIENYYYPERNLGEGWYSYQKNSNPFGILFSRESILITDKSVLELKDSSDFNNRKMKKIDLENFNISNFCLPGGYFNMVYRPIGSIFNQDKLKINKFIPKPLFFDDEIFEKKIKQTGINEYTKRIINLDEKVKQYIDENYNHQLNKLEDKDYYFYVFGTKLDIMNREKVIIKESSLTSSLHYTSLELFNIYLKYLIFRDTLLNFYINNELIPLERLLNKFENSELGMSKFENKSISLLNSINENLIELKEITKVGLNNISNQLENIIEDLDNLNDSNSEIIRNLNFNNLISLVNLYYTYKINKNTK